MDIKPLNTPVVTPNQAPTIVRPVMNKLPAFTPKILAISLGVVLLGIISGWGLASRGTASSEGVPEAKVTKNEAGIENEKLFPDSAEGKLEEGGIDGEGTHHLVRDGGPSKTVYLTSTVIDLQSFVGKNVKVFGETQKARKAPWLMDVGKLKVVE